MSEDTNVGSKTSELAVIEAFIKRVNERAERTIARTRMVSGAHYNAMRMELDALRSQAMLDAQVTEEVKY